MKNVTGLSVIGEDLYGRARELADLWEKLEEGEHVLMLAPRRVGKTSLMQELQRDPRDRWTVIYVDVQGGDGPADCVAAILAALAADPRHRSRFEAMPFSNAVKGVVQRLQAVSLDIGPLRDLSPFQLDSWDRPTAAGFLKELGAGYDFRLKDESIARLLDLYDDELAPHVCELRPGRLGYNPLPAIRRKGEGTMRFPPPGVKTRDMIILLLFLATVLFAVYVMVDMHGGESTLFALGFWGVVLIVLLLVFVGIRGLLVSIIRFIKRV